MHPENSAVPTSQAPSLLKLSACLLYELLAIIALSLVFAGLFYAVFGDATHGISAYCNSCCYGGYSVRIMLGAG